MNRACSTPAILAGLPDGHGYSGNGWHAHVHALLCFPTDVSTEYAEAVIGASRGPLFHREAPRPSHEWALEDCGRAHRFRLGRQLGLGGLRPAALTPAGFEDFFRGGTPTSSTTISAPGLPPRDAVERVMAVVPELGAIILGPPPRL
jgi:hypothetical protein